jgi:type VI protein secretion system component VasF
MRDLRIGSFFKIRNPLQMRVRRKAGIQKKEHHHSWEPLIRLLPVLQFFVHCLPFMQNRQSVIKFDPQIFLAHHLFNQKCKQKNGTEIQIN